MSQDAAAAQLPSLPEPFQQAIKLIDDAHAQDPNLIDGPDGPKSLPYELHYARKMTRWLALHSPKAPAVLQVACRAQHFRRWELPRSSFPLTRPGYLLWRSKQKSQAAAQVSDLIGPLFASASEDDKAAVSRIAALIRKENLATDQEAQALEDVACLVFLDDQFDGFESKPEIDEDKMVGILRKTWGKMGDRGREMALGMDLSERAKLLIGKALEPAA